MSIPISIWQIYRSFNERFRHLQQSSLHSTERICTVMLVTRGPGHLRIVTTACVTGAQVQGRFLSPCAQAQGLCTTYHAPLVPQEVGTAPPGFIGDPPRGQLLPQNHCAHQRLDSPSSPVVGGCRSTGSFSAGLSHSQCYSNHQVWSNQVCRHPPAPSANPAACSMPIAPCSNWSVLKLVQSAVPVARLMRARLLMQSPRNLPVGAFVHRPDKSPNSHQLDLCSHNLWLPSRDLFVCTAVI
jgi:hypothetical protein